METANTAVVDEMDLTDEEVDALEAEGNDSNGGDSEATPGVINITANKEINGEKLSASFDWSYGETVEDSIEMFGGDVVQDHFVRSAVIKAQSTIRSLLVKGWDEESIASFMSENFTPDGRVSVEAKRDPVAAFEAHLAHLSPEERQAVLAKVLGQ